MQGNNLVPSWLTSWVAWRNLYTEVGATPFNLLINEFGLGRLPTSSEFLIKHGGDCPYCHDDAVKNNTRLGLVYCICKVLDQIQKVRLRHEELKTRVGAARLEDINYPHELGGDYARTMGHVVKAANAFIKSPDNWLFINGYYGTGKTHVLKAINTAFDPMALFVSARDLEQMTHKYRKEDALDFFYDALINAPILILDDIGMEYGGPLVKSILDKVVDSRYERWPDYPLVMATNMMEKELPGYIPRAADRLLDKTRTKVLTIISPKSYRKIAPEMRS